MQSMLLFNMRPVVLSKNRQPIFIQKEAADFVEIHNQMNRTNTGSDRPVEGLSQYLFCSFEVDTKKVAFSFICQADSYLKLVIVSQAAFICYASGTVAPKINFIMARLRTVAITCSNRPWLNISGIVSSSEEDAVLV